MNIPKGITGSYAERSIPFQIKIKYLEGAKKLEQTDGGDGIDLYVYEDTEVKAGQRTYINLGVAMELPANAEAILAPRSSTFKHWGLIQTNSIGVIDNSYCGDDDIGMMAVYAFKDVTIPAGTRLCQFRIQEKQPKIQFTEVESLGNKTRGGFGSSGL